MAEANIMQASRSPGKYSSNPFGKAIQGIAATIGLASETVHHHKQKKVSQRLRQNGVARRISNDDDIIMTGLDRSRSQDEAETQKLPTQVDEVAWALDEVQENISANTNKIIPPKQRPFGPPRLADTSLQTRLPESSPATFNRLKLPVVIPQRRPKARTRGFIRAYAPILQDVGIDQESFMDFIDQLNKAVEPSPWISVIDLASLAGHAFPEPIHLLISASALMATQITAEIVSRSKSNAFLEKMNQELFKPKGLIALVITWKPKTVVSEQDANGIIDIDMSTTSASKEPPSDAPADVKRRKSMVQLPSAGTVFELPELAPLVFPELEATTRSPEPRGLVSPGHKRPTQGEDMGSTGDYDQKKKTKSACGAGSKTIGDKEIVQRAEPGCLPAFRQTTAVYVGPAVRQVKLGGKSAGSSVKRTGHFISDYQDRRAVARWSGQHPDSQMAKLAPTPEFQSKFADPNHPASSGDFMALVTGGKRTTAEVSREAMRTTAAASREGMMRVKSTVDDVGLRVGGSTMGGSEAPQRFISPRSKEGLVETKLRRDWVSKLPRTSTADVAPRLRRIGSLPLGNPVRTVKKLLQPVGLFLRLLLSPASDQTFKDILYLMIVNLPTEEDIANAAACLNQVNEEVKAE